MILNEASEDRAAALRGGDNAFGHHRSCRVHGPVLCLNLPHQSARQPYATLAPDPAWPPCLRGMHDPASGPRPLPSVPPDALKLGVMTSVMGERQFRLGRPPSQNNLGNGLPVFTKCRHCDHSFEAVSTSGATSSACFLHLSRLSLPKGCPRQQAAACLGQRVYHDFLLFPWDPQPPDTCPVPSKGISKQ
ncbi:unnamed protein product [Rangifer tarandus platyrhynchus]|uniref:Uncharacterized protein n=2 Tax=Rangifer tarandus platyrhynchus TaxID=3082113 RepID=A0ABN9A577_RANTA|nr:unnamed protein product [Rangifer tarandus platyrhynchus]CAI9712042.1 unnamed protein product [Rangifer tarandus platyrhynchus]